MTGDFTNLLENILTERKSKKDYEVYHKSYTSAVDEMLAFIEKNGYEISEDEVFQSITVGPGRPGNGKTTRHSLELTKGGKEQRKRLQVQVYNMGSSYELNMYIQ